MYTSLASPAAFAALAGLAILLVWTAFMPSRPAKQIEGRLDGYLERTDPTADELSVPFASRALMPLLRRLLRFFGRLAPQRNAAMTRQMLARAGEPLGLQVVDFFGLRLLAAIFFFAAVFVVASRFEPANRALLFAVVGAVVGFLVPVWWLRGRGNSRAHAIQRALPDALDMLTIGVEAGLAFETAMVRVGDKWHNPLTLEFRRAVAEMRVGTARDTALQRMAERCGVEDLSTFIAVLVQSSQLGVSIAEVLHSQAAEMRLKRRQRAEELARQAGVKMVFPLVVFIFPAMFVVILGPAVPDIMSSLGSMAGNVGSGK
jgi:tight adherence protein C